VRMSRETPTLPLIGGVIAAIGASICCAGPLILLLLGVGGSWVSGLTAFEPFRPIFMGAVVIMLTWAGWQLYRPIAHCPEGSICATPSTRRRYRLIFWWVIFVSIVLVMSPYWIPFIA